MQSRGTLFLMLFMALGGFSGRAAAQVISLKDLDEPKIRARFNTFIEDKKNNEVLVAPADKIAKLNEVKIEFDQKKPSLKLTFPARQDPSGDFEPVRKLVKDFLGQSGLLVEDEYQKLKPNVVLAFVKTYTRDDLEKMPDILREAVKKFVKEQPKDDNVKLLTDAKVDLDPKSLNFTKLSVMWVVTTLRDLSAEDKVGAETSLGGIVDHVLGKDPRLLDQAEFDAYKKDTKRMFVVEKKNGPPSPDLTKVLAALKALEDRLKAIEDKLNKTPDIAKLQEAIKMLETQLTAVQEALKKVPDLTKLVDTINALDVRVASMQTRLAGMDEKLTKIQKDVEEIRRTPGGQTNRYLIWAWHPCMHSWVVIGAQVATQKTAVEQIEKRMMARAKVRIEIPEGGKLFVGGKHIDVAPGARTFETPPLVQGQLAYYDMRVETEQDGQLRGETQRVIVQGGADTYVTFSTLRPTPNKSYAKLAPEKTKQVVQEQEAEFRDDYPKNALECYNRGVAAYMDRNYSVARAYLTRAVLLDKDDARFWYYKAFAELAMDNHELATSSVRRAQELKARGLPASDQFDFALKRLPESVQEFLASMPAPKAALPATVAAQR